MRIAILQTNTTKTFPNNALALAIKYFQKTNYSHYVIRIEDPSNGQVFYYDSTRAGSRKSLPSTFNKKHTLYREYRLKKELTYIQWLEFWSQHANKRYGIFQVFGIFLKLLKIIRHNPFGAGTKRLICNELVILLLNFMEYTDIKDTDSLDLIQTEEILKKVI